MDGVWPGTVLPKVADRAESRRQTRVFLTFWHSCHLDLKSISGYNESGKIDCKMLLLCRDGFYFYLLSLMMCEKALADGLASFSLPQ